MQWSGAKSSGANDPDDTWISLGEAVIKIIEKLNPENH